MIKINKCLKEYFMVTIQPNILRITVIVCLSTTMLIVGKVQAQCELEKLQASDTAYQDNFSRSVAIDNDRIVIGANRDDDNGNSSGSVYIYKRVGNNWILEQKLTAGEIGNSDQFGNSVDISGNFLIAGAFLNDEVASSAGAAYIFEYIEETGEWVQQQMLLAPDGHYASQFGTSVSISDNLVVIGAPNQIVNSFDPGAAYAFQLSNDKQSWKFRAKLLASNGADEDRFGESLSIDGEYVIVGAKNAFVHSWSSGTAYVFKQGVNENDLLWFEQSILIPSDGAENDHFGLSVAISGTTSVVGANQNNNELGFNAGAAFVFEYDANKQQWVEHTKLIASDGDTNDRFGKVAIEDNVIVVGATRHNQPVENAGGAYVFQFSPENESWIEHGKVIASDLNYGDNFGAQIDVCNGIAIVSAPFYDIPGTNAGHAFVFNVLANEDNNNNGIIDVCEIGFADLNADGVVDGSDILILLGFWGPCPGPPIECLADLFADGIVNTRDLLILLTYWG